MLGGGVGGEAKTYRDEKPRASNIETRCGGRTNKPNNVTDLMLSFDQGFFAWAPTLAFGAVAADRHTANSCAAWKTRFGELAVEKPPFCGTASVLWVS